MTDCVVQVELRDVRVGPACREWLVDHCVQLRSRWYSIHQTTCLHEARREGMAAHLYWGLDPFSQLACDTVSRNYLDLRPWMWILGDRNVGMMPSRC